MRLMPSCATLAPSAAPLTLVVERSTSRPSCLAPPITFASSGVISTVCARAAPSANARHRANPRQTDCGLNGMALPPAFVAMKARDFVARLTQRCAALNHSDVARRTRAHTMRGACCVHRRRDVMETQVAPSVNEKPSFAVRPLSPALGAEIVGVDLRQPVSEALAAQLLQAWHQHLVILLRDQ